MAKKWLPVPGFIGFVTLIAGFLIQDYVLLLSKWNSITRYPVIFNFRVGTGRALEKKFGTGRVPGSRQTLLGSDTLKTIHTPHIVDIKSVILPEKLSVCNRIWATKLKMFGHWRRLPTSITFCMIMNQKENQTYLSKHTEWSLLWDVLPEHYVGLRYGE